MPMIVTARNYECEDDISRVHDSHVLERASCIHVYILCSSNWQKLERGKFLFHVEALGLYPLQVIET